MVEPLAWFDAEETHIQCVACVNRFYRVVGPKVAGCMRFLLRSSGLHDYTFLEESNVGIPHFFFLLRRRIQAICSDDTSRYTGPQRSYLAVALCCRVVRCQRPLNVVASFHASLNVTRVVASCSCLPHGGQVYSAARAVVGTIARVYAVVRTRKHFACAQFTSPHVSLFR